MHRIAIALAALSAVLFCVPAARARSDGAKPFFPLGIWYEGGVGDARDHVLPAEPAKAAEVYDKNFADVAAHGINVMTVPNSPPDHHKLVLDTAHRHGLKIILELGLDGGELGHMVRGQMPLDDNTLRETLEKRLGPLKNHPALWRVQLLDEPGEDGFARYAKVAKGLRTFAPRTGPFCCLVGTVDGERFLRETKSDVIAFDVYPIAVGMKVGDAKPLMDWVGFADRFAHWAEKYDAESWAVLQCHEITGALRFPTDGEVRAMSYAALATGNKGIFWFLYQTERVGADSVMSGFVDRDFKARPHWDGLTGLTRELAKLTPHLEDLRDPQVVAVDDPLLLVRRLTDSKGVEYFFAVNMDAVKSRTVSIPYAVPPQRAGKFKVVEVPEGGVSMIMDNQVGPGSKVVASWAPNLPAGTGKLYRIEPTEK